MDYEIIYSKRKSIALVIKDCRLIVRAPSGVGAEFIEKIVNDKAEWIKKHIRLDEHRREKSGVLSGSDITRLKKDAYAYLTKKTSEYADIMGLKCGRVSITSAKTRFGSCSSKGNICYSWRLMLYPEAARDYVVVHELCHLVHMNHSKKFYSLLEKYMPDYKDRKRLLKE